METGQTLAAWAGAWPGSQAHYLLCSVWGFTVQPAVLGLAGWVAFGLSQWSPGLLEMIPHDSLLLGAAWMQMPWERRCPGPAGWLLTSWGRLWSASLWMPLPPQIWPHSLPRQGSPRPWRWSHWLCGWSGRTVWTLMLVSLSGPGPPLLKQLLSLWL